MGSFQQISLGVVCLAAAFMFGNYVNNHSDPDQVTTAFDKNEVSYAEFAEFDSDFRIPEGKETNEFYVDGFKTANSEEQQLKTLRGIKGMENIIMTRPGYGIKYNILSPFQINKNLESKKFPGLFFCGRVNGLSEYESNAAQGYIAGVNALKKIIK